MGVCKKIKRKDEQEECMGEYLRKKGGPGLGTDPAEYEKKNK